VAKEFVKTVNGTPVTMWGFARDSGSGCSGTDVPTVPGPDLAIPHGTSSLTIEVRNCLAEPISLVIPGLVGALDPTFVSPTGTYTGSGNRPAADVTSRIRSFDHEIEPGGIHSYVWSNVHPGTYLYVTGTHPDVQVQMGLYGMLRVNVANGVPYPGEHYDNEALMIYSEIDPRRPVVSSALGYEPAYFLVNGEPYPAAAPVLDHPLAANEKVLFRFLNAGLQSHVPTLLNGYVHAVAEDGHPYPYARDQYGLLLPAGKSLDGTWTPDQCGGSFPLLDRRLWLANPGVGTPGGMLVTLASAGSNHPGAPTANDEGYSAVQGITFSVPAPGVLGNDSSLDPMTAVLVAGPAHGTLVLDPDGGLRYTPYGDYAGPDSFTYKANDCEDSNVATVTFNVATEATNQAPQTLPDSYTVAEDGVLSTPAPGILGNDSDPDLNPLTAVFNTGVSHGTLIFNSNGSFEYTPFANYNGPDSFTYRVTDGQLYSAVTAVTLDVTPVNDAPVANDDKAQTTQTSPVHILVLANDTDADGNSDIDTLSLVRATLPRNGTISFPGDGAVIYTARAGFVGSDQFSYTVRDLAGAQSNVAVVRINVVK
jgi:FtsP/CotA-like multicopper oxidase with cupredoxin domain